MNHLPAGPGGDFVCQTADMATSARWVSPMERALRRPSSKSVRTAWSGIPPNLGYEYVRDHRELGLEANRHPLCARLQKIHTGDDAARIRK
jgi:hypothetical protein